jgi:hypothetical protein
MRDDGSIGESSSRSDDGHWIVALRARRRDMTATADPCDILERKVGMRVRDDESHRVLGEALTEVAVAAIHPARHLGLGRSGSRGMLGDPIESATHAAVETLVAHLELLFEGLPRETIDQLAHEQLVAEHGME